MKTEKCSHCDGKGKIKIPKDREQFDRYVDLEMDKGYFINMKDAMEIAYKKVGFILVDCPYCKKQK